VLAVRCELLLGSYQAQDPFGGSEAAEWPPHPYRLHAALVGAACEAGGERPAAEDLDVLRWLERQGPPSIACSATVSHRTQATVWVPPNPTRGAEWDRYVKAGSAVNRVARSIPTAVPEDPAVGFVWPDAEAPSHALWRLVESIGWLGSSRSPVACAVTAEAPPATFLPDARGEWQARVAAKGLTDALLKGRFTHPQPVRPPVMGYRLRGARRAARPAIASAPFSALLVRRVTGAVQETAEAPLVAAALRLAGTGFVEVAPPPKAPLASARRTILGGA